MNCKKMMTIPFFDIRGLIDIHYFKNKTVNQRNFEPVLCKVWNVLRIQRREQWRQNHRIHLYMDNAPVHQGSSVQCALQEIEWRQIAHPPYSPDLSPYDFFIFPYLKRKLRGREYPDLDQLRTAIECKLGEVTALQWRQCFKDWLRQCRRCLAFNSSYFEGMKFAPN